MKRVNSLLLAAAVGLACLLQAEQAEAQRGLSYSQFYNPFGNATVNAVIGQTQGQTVAVFRNIATDECHSWVLGDSSGLDNNYVYNGGAGVDNVNISDRPSWNPEHLCGYSITALLYNGRFLDLWGNDGNDSFVAQSGDTCLVGGGGADFLSGRNPTGWYLGGDGDDVIIAWGSGTQQGLDGGPGNDCLTDTNSAASSFYDCGSGTDLSGASNPVNAVNCETYVSYSCGQR